MHIVPFAPGSGPDARPDPPRAVASRFTPPAAQQNALIYGGHVFSQAGIPGSVISPLPVISSAARNLSLQYTLILHFRASCHFERSEKSFPPVQTERKISPHCVRRNDNFFRSGVTADFSSLRSSK